MCVLSVGHLFSDRRSKFMLGTKCSSVWARPLVVRWVVELVLHDVPIEPFSRCTLCSMTRLVKQFMDGAYRNNKIAASQKP